MNVDELISYKPSLLLEESIADGSSSSGNHQRGKSSKRKLDELEQLMPPPSTSGHQADSAQNSDLLLDESRLRRIILQFERKMLRNQELRVKFADQPTKFLDSEMQLYDAIQELHVISTQPELYPQFLEGGRIVSQLLGLLSHENADIAGAVTCLLQELSSLENEEERDQVDMLLDALLEGQIVVQLVSNLGRLDESAKEEADCVHNSLTIIETLLDYKPELSNDCQPLLLWILQRLKSKFPFDSNKLYAVEILSILLQNHEENRRFLGEQNGIDCLLQQIAYFKRHEPTSPDEHEYMENLFDCLCSALLCSAENRQLFYEGEGIELMNLILREKRKRVCQSSVKIGAIKVISHAVNGDKPKDEFLAKCADKVVDVYGLRALFPILMVPKSIIHTRNKKKTRELTDAVDEIEEHILTTLLAIIRYANTENRARCIYKFVETEFEKTEKLAELHFKYSARLIRAEQQIAKEKARLAAYDEELDEDEILYKRLQNGLFQLQLVDQILVVLCSQSAADALQDVFQLNNDLKGHLLKLINMRSSQHNHYKLIKRIIQESIENETDTDEKDKLQAILDEF